MKNVYFTNSTIYCYVVSIIDLEDVGLTPKIHKVFLTYNSAKKCCDFLKKNYITLSPFIVKKLLQF